MRYYMFNKPKNCVTARTDALDKTVMDFFPEDMKNELHPIGRLDKDTVGLLLITDDGMLTHRLMQPRSHVSKRYFFYAVGKLDDDKINAVREGLMIKGLDEPVRPAEICSLWSGKITEIVDFLPEKKCESLLKNPAQDVFSGYITITEGKNHQVKRMLKALNCCILYLKRVSVGGVELDPALPEGSWRPLTDDECAALGI